MVEQEGGEDPPGPSRHALRALNKRVNEQCEPGSGSGAEGHHEQSAERGRGSGVT